MANSGQGSNQLFRSSFRRIFAFLTFFMLVSLFLFWRIQGERAESMRAKIIDLLPSAIEFGTKPGELIYDFASGIQDIVSSDERISQLEDEVKSLKRWREYAHVIEQENANLRNVAKVVSQTRNMSFTAEVFADTSNHFAQSVLINAGAENGISDGWPATDGLGLVGRVTSVGDSVSRVILLTDPNSRIPVMIEPSGSHALVIGDSSSKPLIQMVQAGEAIALGDRVVTSGVGGVFPSDMLVGYVEQGGADRRLRVNLAADYRKLQFVAILEVELPETITESDGLIVAESLGLDKTALN